RGPVPKKSTRYSSRTASRRERASNRPIAPPPPMIASRGRSPGSPTPLLSPFCTARPDSTTAVPAASTPPDAGTQGHRAGWSLRPCVPVSLRRDGRGGGGRGGRIVIRFAILYNRLTGPGRGAAKARLRTPRSRSSVGSTISTAHPVRRGTDPERIRSSRVDEDESTKTPVEVQSNTPMAPAEDDRDVLRRGGGPLPVLSDPGRGGGCLLRAADG